MLLRNDSISDFAANFDFASDAVLVPHVNHQRILRQLECLVQVCRLEEPRPFPPRNSVELVRRIDFEPVAPIVGHQLGFVGLAYSSQNASYDARPVITPVVSIETTLEFSRK